MTTSNAAQTFALAIKDAENQVHHFDELNTNPVSPNSASQGNADNQLMQLYALDFADVR